MDDQLKVKTTELTAKVRTLYVTSFTGQLRLRCTIRLNFLLVTLLLYISGTITDISLKQVPFQHYNTKWNSWNRKVKCPRVFGPRQLDSLLKHSCVKLLRGRLEPNPQKFSGTTTQYLLGRDEEIFGDLCIFLAMCTKTYRIIQEERALGMHNFRFVPKFCDFFSCRPAKYTRLPVQQVKTREKQFPFVKFDAWYKASLVCG